VIDCLWVACLGEVSTALSTMTMMMLGLTIMYIMTQGKFAAVYKGMLSGGLGSRLMSLGGSDGCAVTHNEEVAVKVFQYRHNRNIQVSGIAYSVIA